MSEEKFDKRVLILEGFFIENKILNILNKFYYPIRIQRLKRFIIDLKRKNKQNLKIDLITAEKKRFFISNNVNVKSVSEYRLQIKRENYLELKKNVIKQTRNNMIQLFQNLKSISQFQIEGLSLVKIIEIYITRILNKTFLQLAFLTQLLDLVNYDKVILLNTNIECLNYLKITNINPKKVSIYSDNLIKVLTSLTKIFQNFYVFFYIIKDFFKKKKKPLIPKLKSNNSRKNIIFVANTNNQLDSIKPVFQTLKKRNKFNLFLYKDLFYISNRRRLFLIFFFIRLKLGLKIHSDLILNNLKYENVNLSIIHKLFEISLLFEKILQVYIIHYNFKQLIMHLHPRLVILTDDLGFQAKHHSLFCKLNNTFTMYIPHAAIPILDEIITNREFSFITVSGEKDKEFFKNQGIPEEKIVITGRPKYDNFLKMSNSGLNEIIDIFNNQVFKFSSKQFTILLTTNPIDYRSNERIIRSVVNSIKYLNLDLDLIIKLHPREDGRDHLKILKSLEFKPIIIKNYDILKVIKSCDLLLSRKSTTVLEAILLGKPVILLDFVNLNYKETSKYLFLEEEEIISVSNESALTTELKKLVENPEELVNYSNKLHDISIKHVYIDKKETATSKIVKNIETLLDK